MQVSGCCARQDSANPNANPNPIYAGEWLRQAGLRRALRRRRRGVSSVTVWPPVARLRSRKHMLMLFISRQDESHSADKQVFS